ncbi:MAG: hypothetical protein NXY57DRAFT_1079556 [Lentinula lateritia]|nr:MAG: hypothetical protein NXY57DRAFT_1079556 [Lentinula lateritia]
MAVLERPMLDMNLFKDQLSEPVSNPSATSAAPDDPFKSSSRILLYKALGWSTALNPRRLENDWIPAWELTAQLLLDPLSRPNRTFIAAGQRYLWHQDDVEEVKNEARMRNKQLKHVEEIEAAEEEAKDIAVKASGVLEEDIDGDYNLLAEVSFESHYTQAATRSVGRIVTLHEGVPDITVLETSFTQLKYPEYIPDDDASDAGSEVGINEIDLMDEDVFTENVPSAEYPGFSISAASLTGDEASVGPWSPQVILQKLRNKFLHAGGYDIQGCTPRALVELKTLPCRSVVRHRFDTQTAWASFLDALTSAHRFGMEDLATYTVLLFKRYVELQEFLAIVGAGPFWRWAIIHRHDVPWKEPGRHPRTRRLHRWEYEQFYKHFTEDYFELGTTRSDEELQKLKEIFFVAKDPHFAKNRAAEAQIRFKELTKWREAQVERGDWYWLPRAERKAKYKEYNEELRERQERIPKTAGRKH